MNRVLCLIDSLASGGAERQMSYLVTGLKANGYDVRLVVFSMGYDFYESYITERGVEVIHDAKGLNPYRRILRIIKHVRDFRPDAVIAYKDGVTMAACLAKMFCNFRLIVSERNTTQELTKYESRKFRLYRRADVIVPNSYSQGQFIKTNFPELADKVTVITNAVDFERFNGEKPKRPDGTALRCVTLARLMPQKNVLTFLDALHILQKKHNVQNIHFDWYGSQSDTEYCRQVFDRVTFLELENYITFHNPEKEIVPILNSADFFFLPSVYEGFANVLCEAMACGLPIVCSNVSDNGYIVEGGVNGFLFNPGSAEDIAEKILRMTQNTEQFMHMGKVNKQKITNLCSSDTFIDKYCALI